MHLRKIITLGAAVVAAGLLTLTPAVQASNPTGANITQIATGSGTTAGTDAVGGVFKSGTATFVSLGYTASCSGGTVGGAINRGPFTSGGVAFVFDNLSITCNTPLGINATISLNPGCTVNVTMGGRRTPNDNVHTSYPSGTVDTGLYTGTTQKVHNVLGRMQLPAPALHCVKVTLSSGGCVAYAQGSTDVEFDEAVKTVGGVDYQDLILRGTGLSLYDQNGSCFGLMSGNVTLNNIDFNLRTTSVLGPIDFR